jgi:hypothetical protein
MRDVNATKGKIHTDSFWTQQLQHDGVVVPWPEIDRNTTSLKVGSPA